MNTRFPDFQHTTFKPPPHAALACLIEAVNAVFLGKVKCLTLKKGNEERL